METLETHHSEAHYCWKACLHGAIDRNIISEEDYLSIFKDMKHSLW